MSDEFDDGDADFGSDFDDFDSTPGPGRFSGHFDDAAERDKLLGALADAMGNKDSAATRQLIEDLQDFHGSDENIDLPLDAALRNFRDWGDPGEVFEACRQVTEWARRDGGPKDTAMATILDLAKRMGEKSIGSAYDGLTSVLHEAPDDSSYHAGAVENLFQLADIARERSPADCQKILNALIRNADDGSAEKNRAVDAMIALAEHCRESDTDLAQDAARDALYAMDDGDPRQAKVEDFRDQLDGTAGRNRAEGYQENAKPLTPDAFRQRFG